MTSELLYVVGNQSTFGARKCYRCGIEMKDSDGGAKECRCGYRIIPTGKAFTESRTKGAKKC